MVTSRSGEGGLGYGAARDPARQGGALRHGGEDRPQGRPRHRPAAAHGLVPARSWQVSLGSGGAGAARRAQAAAGEDARCGAQPAGSSARFRPQGWRNQRGTVCAACSHPGRGPTMPERIAEAMLQAREALRTEFGKLHRAMLAIARDNEVCRRLMTVPGIGALIAITFISAVDSPERFARSKALGAHFGLTPRKYQSGETDVTGAISRVGDAMVRTALYEGAHIILTRVVRFSALKRWAMEVAKRRPR